MDILNIASKSTTQRASLVPMVALGDGSFGKSGMDAVHAYAGSRSAAYFHFQPGFQIPFFFFSTFKKDACFVHVGTGIQQKHVKSRRRKRSHYNTSFRRNSSTFHSQAMPPLAIKTPLPPHDTLPSGLSSLASSPSHSPTREMSPIRKSALRKRSSRHSVTSTSIYVEPVSLNQSDNSVGHVLSKGEVSSRKHSASVPRIRSSTRHNTSSRTSACSRGIDVQASNDAERTPSSSSNRRNGKVRESTLPTHHTEKEYTTDMRVEPHAETLHVSDATHNGPRKHVADDSASKGDLVEEKSILNEEFYESANDSLRLPPTPLVPRRQSSGLSRDCIPTFCIRWNPLPSLANMASVLPPAVKKDGKTFLMVGTLLCRCHVFAKCTKT